ncbi:MAG: hypothetical protein HYX91_03555 [Chloroflexi bacterium]|nr:hypothetical protein [Chloroflexota bacterium]
MEKYFWNKTNIYGLAGIVSWAITVLVLFIPFKGDSTVSLVIWNSPLGIIVITLFVIAVVLYAYALFKTEKRLSFNDQKAIVSERQKVLPELRESVEKRLKALRPLMNKAEKLPLMQYWEKYLKNTMPYLVTKRKPQKPIEITNKLVRKKFPINNLYYYELKETDPFYKRILDNYNIILSKVDDKKLKKKLHSLWWLEHIARSLQIYASLSMNNKKIPNVPMGYRGGYRGKQYTEDGFQIQLKDIESRINELLRGDDL